MIVYVLKYQNSKMLMNSQSLAKSGSSSTAALIKQISKGKKSSASYHSPICSTISSLLCQIGSMIMLRKVLCLKLRKTFQKGLRSVPHMDFSILIAICSMDMDSFKTQMRKIRCFLSLPWIQMTLYYKLKRMNSMGTTNPYSESRKTYQEKILSI